MPKYFYYPFESDPEPAPEDVWRPRRGLHFTQQFYGLYDGEMPVKTFRITKYRHKRPFHVMPQVYEVNLYSELLDKCFAIKATQKALISIDKMGGLDNYLLKNTLDQINSYVGIDIRKELRAELAKRGIIDLQAEEKERIEARNKQINALLQKHEA